MKKPFFAYGIITLSIISFSFTSIILLLPKVGNKEVSLSNLVTEPDFEDCPNCHKTLYAYQLTASLSSSKVKIDEELSLKVTLEGAGSNSFGGVLVIKIFSPSFEVYPSEDITLPLGSGEFSEYILKPIETGKRKVKVYANYKTIDSKYFDVIPQEDLPKWEQIFDIEVVDKVSIWGISENFIKIIQAVSGIIGLPGLLVLLISQRIKKKKKRKK